MVLTIPGSSDAAVSGSSSGTEVAETASDKSLEGDSAAQAKAQDSGAPAIGDSQEAVEAGPVVDEPSTGIDQWYVRTDEGDEYGPVTKAELDSWVEEERVDGACQILQKGSDDWKWADELYPELVQAEPADENPFAALAGAEAETARPSSGGSDIDGEVLDEQPSGSGSASGLSQLGIERVLTESRPWVQIMAVFGFFTGGAWLIGCIYFFVMATANTAILGMTLSLIGLVGPALLILGSYFLYLYSHRILAFERTGGARELQGAIAAQRAFWKLAGVVSAIVLAVYAVLGLVVLVARLLEVSVFGPG
jgi:hypothetical protein